MKQKNYETGKFGERIASDFLIKNGYRIIEKNFHTRFGEIDLVASKSDRLMFVEVKLKVGENFGTPEEMITKYKIKQIEKTGEMFLIKNPKYERYFDSLQIDAICIVLDENRNVKRIDHYEGITS